MLIVWPILALTFICSTFAAAAETQTNSEELLKEAAKEGLPVEFLRNMTIEGKMKGIEENRIYKAIEKAIENMRKAREILPMNAKGNSEILKSSNDAMQAGLSASFIGETAKAISEGKGSENMFRYALIAATDLRLRGGSETKIKELITTMVSRGAEEDSFQRLAKAQQRVKNILACDEDMAMTYIVEEFLRGKSLFEMLEEFPRRGDEEAHPSDRMPGNILKEGGAQSSVGGQAADSAPFQRANPVDIEGIKKKWQPSETQGGSNEGKTPQGGKKPDSPAPPTGGKR